MKKWKVTGFINLNIQVEEFVEAETMEEAGELGEYQALDRIPYYPDLSINDSEIYAEECE